MTGRAGDHLARADPANIGGVSRETGARRAPRGGGRDQGVILIPKDNAKDVREIPMEDFRGGAMLRFPVFASNWRDEVIRAGAAARDPESFFRSCRGARDFAREASQRAGGKTRRTRAGKHSSEGKPSLPGTGPGAGHPLGLAGAFVFSSRS